jgi:hypothetical protein
VSAPEIEPCDECGGTLNTHGECYRCNSEYQRGVALAEHIRFTAQMFGEDAAYAEELAWELKDPDPSY